MSTAEGEALAKEYNIHFFETSAKQDTNVDKAFITIATEIKDRMIVDGQNGGNAAGGQKITAGKGNEESKGGCCGK